MPPSRCSCQPDADGDHRAPLGATTPARSNFTGNYPLYSSYCLSRRRPVVAAGQISTRDVLPRFIANSTAANRPPPAFAAFRLRAMTQSDGSILAPSVVGSSTLQNP